MRTSSRLLVTVKDKLVSTAVLAVLAAVLIALAAGCADTTDYGDDDAGADQEAGQQQPCNEGETRCSVDNSYQRCQGGDYVDVEACGEDLVCVVDRGCRECDPGIGQGCRDNAIHACDDQGKLGAKIKDCLGLTCEGGACISPRCAAGAKLVYVVDNEHQLFSFDPTKEHNHFTLIATLECPAGPPLDPMALQATPFSMSVDRSARAWVLYTSGEIFWVDTETGACTPSPFVSGQEGFVLFGMGFVADQPGSDKERLYASTEGLFSAAPNRLGSIDPATLELSGVGVLDAPPTTSAELSGTGEAELYAFFPDENAFVAKVDKRDGTLLQKWSIPPIIGVRSWAFAHWGGSFFIFVTSQALLEPEVRRVYELDPAADKAQVFIDPMPYRIVGAGVSTCAPVIK